MNRYALALLLCLALCVGCGDTIHNHFPTPDPAPIVDPLPVPPVETKPGILGPESVEPGQPLWLTANLEPDSVATWTVESPDGLSFRTYEDQHEFASAGPIDAKEVRVALSVARIVAEKIEQRVIRKTIVVGQSPNPPPGPDPPGPTPDPEPPEPPPAPAPIPARGLHVIVVFESGDTLSMGQQAILYGEEARGYLDTHCQVYTDKSRAYRIYDKDVDVSEDWPVWQEAMKRPRESVPWVIVSNGTTGFEGPLPETVESFLELVKKYEVAK